MIIDKIFLDKLTEEAKDNPRLRMFYDLRNSSEDHSQRMLNAIEPGTDIAIHRHLDSSETVTCIRGHFQENLYDFEGNLTEVIDMLPGVVLNVPIGQWHSLKSLESGTVLMSFMDGAYRPMSEDEIWKEQ